MLMAENIVLNGMTMNDIGKKHMFLRIHMEGVCWVPLIKLYMKDIYEMDTDMFYPLSYTNKYIFTLYIIVLSFTTDI